MLKLYFQPQFAKSWESSFAKWWIKSYQSKDVLIFVNVNNVLSATISKFAQENCINKPIISRTFHGTETEQWLTYWSECQKDDTTQNKPTIFGGEKGLGEGEERWTSKMCGLHLSMLSHAERPSAKIFQHMQPLLLWPSATTA